MSNGILREKGIGIPKPAKAMVPVPKDTKPLKAKMFREIRVSIDHIVSEGGYRILLTGKTVGKDQRSVIHGWEIKSLDMVGDEPIVLMADGILVGTLVEDTDDSA